MRLDDRLGEVCGFELIATGGTDEDAYLHALEVADDLPALAPGLPANANTQQPHGRVAA